MNPFNCTQALAAAQRLGIDRLDAQLLLLHALGKPASDRSWLVAHDTDELAPDVVSLFHAMSLRRAGGEPLAYIVGYKDFFGLSLQVDQRVLVPRPDTETLVEWSLAVLNLQTLTPPLKVLDLGTGSGAIALAIAHSLKATDSEAQVTAVDASANALNVARENARRLGVDVAFIESFWLQEVQERFQLIVSNPPYIASADPHLAALAHEPLQALTAGADGLDDIRHIIRQAPGHLLPGGWLLLEHGYDQADAVQQLMQARGFKEVSTHFDLGQQARCTGGQFRL